MSLANVKSFDMCWWFFFVFVVNLEELDNITIKFYWIWKDIGLFLGKVLVRNSVSLKTNCKLFEKLSVVPLLVKKTFFLWFLFSYHDLQRLLVTMIILEYSSFLFFNDMKKKMEKLWILYSFIVLLCQSVSNNNIDKTKISLFHLRTLSKTTIWVVDDVSVSLSSIWMN